MFMGLPAATSFYKKFLVLISISVPYHASQIEGPGDLNIKGLEIFEVEETYLGTKGAEEKITIRVLPISYAMN